MKNTLLTLLMVLGCLGTAFAQKAPYTDQEFVLREVTMKENTATLKGQLQFSFKIFGRYPSSQLEGEPGFSYPSYMLRFWLADANGDTLVSDKADESLLQRFSFFTAADTGTYKTYSFGHHIVFPYGAFRKSGQQTFSLWAQAQSPRGDVRLKPFKTGSYTVSIPKLHTISEQQVQIKQTEVTETATEVALRFSTRFLYGADELYAPDETSDEVVFYAEITKPDGSPVTLINDPKLSQNTKNSSQYAVLRQTKNTDLKGEIRVPYTQFYLPEGIQEIQYRIHAVTRNGSRRWENLYHGKYTLHMPPVYFARAVVKNICVASRTYDLAAKDIPIINLFVSQSGTQGKGYPDLFWEFGSNGHEIMSTSVTHNSFCAQNDSCFFQMMENDRLTLGVYDFDMLTFNDKLGYFTLPLMRGETTYVQNTLRDDDVVNGQIFVERKRRPATPTLDLQVQASQNQGVTGYKIWGNVTNNSSLFQTKLFLRQPDGTHLVPMWQKIAVPGAEFAGFIPAWDYPLDAKVGLLVTDKQYNLPVTQQYVQPDKRITESNDVQLRITNPQEVTQNGVYGLRLTVTAVYPAGITAKNAFRFLYTLKETGGVDLKPFIEKGQLAGSPLCGEAECGLTLFVPYFLLSDFSGKTLHALFHTEIQVAKNRFTVGKNEADLSLAVPQLIPAPKATFSTNLKFKKTWSYVEIATEYNGQKNILVKEKADGGKFAQELVFPAGYVYGKDTLSLVITPYEFRTAQPEVRWNFTAEELLKAGTLALKKTAQTKKPILKAH